MSDPIQIPGSMPPIDAGLRAQGPASGEPAAGKDFKTVLLDSLDEVNQLQTEADAGVQRLLTGETNNVAEVFAAVNKAGVAFDLLMEVRNKMTEAYREIQQMRV